MRLAIFIDAGYLFKVLSNELGDVHLDFERLPGHIQSHVNSDIDLLRSYYYHCLPYQSNPPTPEEKQRFSKGQKFHAFLDRLPRFQVRLGRLARRGPDETGAYRYEQKLVDVLLSVDLVQLSATHQITHAVLVAGDSDFCPAVEVAKNNGVSIWLLHGDRPHQDLWNLADERIRLDNKFVSSIKR